MPEGDTILHAALAIDEAIGGRVPSEIRTPHPRHRRDGWEQRLAGRTVTGVDTLGKHLFLRFEGDLTLHSHLRMTGLWHVGALGGRTPRAAYRAWLVLSTQERAVTQFDGPVLELMTEARSRNDPRFAQLGPDVLGPNFDIARYLGRLRAGDPRRAIGDAILDQRIIAGIGNVWKAELCFAVGIDPWRAVSAVSDEEATQLASLATQLMPLSVRDGPRARPGAVYGRAGCLCERCGTRIEQRAQGDNNRVTYWCPGCQR